MKFASLIRFAALSTCAVTACTDDPEPTGPFVAPATRAEVDSLYDSLGTCNGSHLERTLTPRSELRAETVWSAPVAAPANFDRWRAPDGRWTSAALVSELTFDSLSEFLRSPDADCDAIARLWSFARAPGSTREQFTHALLYLEDGQHPYSAFPADGIDPLRAPARIALQGYLSVISAERERVEDGYLYSDMIEQHLPMYVSCTGNTQIEASSFFPSELRGIDPAMCNLESPDLYQCVAESGVHADDTECTYVVDGTGMKTLDGLTRDVVFGGTIEVRDNTTGAGLKYDLTVDRFSR